MQSVVSNDHTKRFYSRVVNSNNENNGQSVTLRHDCLKINKMSYADVVVKNVKILAGNQVDNYPWQPGTVCHLSNITNHVTDHVIASGKSQVVNTDQTHVPYSNKEGIPSKGVNIKRRSADLKSIVSHDSNTKVRISKVFTRKPSISVTSQRVNDTHSLNSELLTPVVDNNRFWPLIDLMNNQEEEVVLHESKSVGKVYKGKKVKPGFVRRSRHTDMNTKTPFRMTR